MRKKVRFWLASALCVALGCGDSDGGKPDASTPDAGHDAGMDDTPPINQVDSGSSEPEPMEFMCEQTMCTVPSLNIESLMLPPIMGFEVTPELIESMGFGPMGCCVDGDKCGVTQEMIFGAGFCAEQDQAGEPSTECPNEEAELLGLITLNLEGCCRTDNKCGLNLDLIGVGCVEREEAAMIQIMGMSLPNADMITAVDCGDVGADAGTL